MLENKSGENVQNTLSSSQYDLREYNDALLDEMKKNVKIGTKDKINVYK